MRIVGLSQVMTEYMREASVCIQIVKASNKIPNTRTIFSYSSSGPRRQGVGGKGTASAKSFLPGLAMESGNHHDVINQTAFEHLYIPFSVNDHIAVRYCIEFYDPGSILPGIGIVAYGADERGLPCFHLKAGTTTRTGDQHKFFFHWFWSGIR